MFTQTYENQFYHKTYISHSDITHEYHINKKIDFFFLTFKN